MESRSLTIQQRDLRSQGEKLELEVLLTNPAACLAVLALAVWNA
jgi:hypothetical protein